MATPSIGDLITWSPSSTPSRAEVRARDSPGLSGWTVRVVLSAPKGHPGRTSILVTHPQETQPARGLWLTSDQVRGLGCDTEETT